MSGINVDKLGLPYMQAARIAAVEAKPIPKEIDEKIDQVKGSIALNVWEACRDDDLTFVVAVIRKNRIHDASPAELERYAADVAVSTTMSALLKYYAKQLPSKAKLAVPQVIAPGSAKIPRHAEASIDRLKQKHFALREGSSLPKAVVLVLPSKVKESLQLLKLKHFTPRAGNAPVGSLAKKVTALPPPKPSPLAATAPAAHPVSAAGQFSAAAAASDPLPLVVAAKPPSKMQQSLQKLKEKNEALRVKKRVLELGEAEFAACQTLIKNKDPGTALRCITALGHYNYVYILQHLGLLCKVPIDVLRAVYNYDDELPKDVKALIGRYVPVGK
jgi:hypothetical protein